MNHQKLQVKLAKRTPVFLTRLRLAMEQAEELVYSIWAGLPSYWNGKATCSSKAAFKAAGKHFSPLGVCVAGSLKCQMAGHVVNSLISQRAVILLENPKKHHQHPPL